MNVERLNLILKSIQSELARNSGVMNNLSSQLAQQVAQPNQPNHQKAVVQSLTQLRESAGNAESNRFSPGWRQALAELGVADLLGATLVDRVNEILGRNQITPSVAQEELQAIATALATKRQGVDQVLAGLPSLGVEPDDLDEGTGELGMIIPRLAIGEQLQKFEQELRDLNFIARCFYELTTGSVPQVRIRSLASSDFAVYLLTEPAVIQAITASIESLLGAYEKILSIRSQRQKMLENDVPDEALESVDKHLAGVMKEAISSTTKMLMKQGEPKGGRANEVEVHLEGALTKIANKIDNGFSFEVRARVTSSDADDPEQAATIAQTERIGSLLSFPKVEGGPILSLPEPDADGGPKSDKGDKKKK